MSRIDYSKWDNIDYGSSDEDDEAAPRVTRLDQPSRIRVGGGSVDVLPEEATPADKRLGDKAGPASPSLATDEIPSSWTHQGSQCTVGGYQLWWNQDRYSATIRMLLPPPTNGYRCRVNGLWSFEDRCNAVGTGQTAQLILERDSNVVLASQLAYPIHAGQDDDNEVDWSLETHNAQKYLVVLLHKATPMAGLILWWKRPLLDCDEINLDFRGDGGGQLAENWEQAHAEFQARRRAAAADDNRKNVC